MSPATQNDSLIITTPSDREIAMTRVFNAPRTLVFEAYTKPALVKQWLGVRGGWKLDVCEIDLKKGGKYRYVWKHEKGAEMGMGGVFREVVPNERIVSSEKFDQAWYEGECIGTVTFVEKAGKTSLTMALLYDSKKIRDAVLASPMKDGIVDSFNLLEQILGGGK
jgi:uncharacterized protein YndB with AHSA1/START domain